MTGYSSCWSPNLNVCTCTFHYYACSDGPRLIEALRTSTWNSTNAALSPIIQTSHNEILKWNCQLEKESKMAHLSYARYQVKRMEALKFIITACCMDSCTFVECFLFSLIRKEWLCAWTMEQECKRKRYSKQGDTWTLRIRTVFKCEWEIFRNCGKNKWIRSWKAK